MDERVVSVRHLGKSFNDNHVLVDVSFDLEPGENLIIMGKSGSGKSVLLKCLMRLMEADTGEIVLFGSNLSQLGNEEMNDLRKRVGFLFQGAALYDSMTVRENLEFPLRATRKQLASETETKVMEVLNSVKLAAAADKMPSELSGGMKKRIGLARALILKPEIILYDEPTTGLDPVTAKEISHLIVEVQKANDTSAIIITHDVKCARVTAGRILLIKEGSIYASGTYEELSSSVDSWIKSFFE